MNINEINTTATSIIREFAVDADTNRITRKEAVSQYLGTRGSVKDRLRILTRIDLMLDTPR